MQSIAWHPHHEKLFVSGGWEGSMHFWQTDQSTPIASMEGAHESSVFALDWHPLGHILGSGSNDHTTKFWTRNRPGDPMNDRYNLSKEEASAIGLVSEDAPDVFQSMKSSNMQDGLPGLPGLGTDAAKAKQGTGYSSFRDNGKRDNYQRQDRYQNNNNGNNRQQNNRENNNRNDNRDNYRDNNGRSDNRNNNPYERDRDNRGGRDNRDNRNNNRYNNNNRY